LKRDQKPDLVLIAWQEKAVQMNEAGLEIVKWHALAAMPDRCLE
jgi:hypothetical protein